MSENPSEPLDVRTIHHLVRLMKRYDLTAIDFVDGATKIRLRRQGPEQVPVPAWSSSPDAHLVIPTRAQMVPPTTPSSSPASPPPAPAPAAASGITIDSPMVGTFYASGSPDAPPYVNVGSVVRPDTTVCIIEAMKVFTDIPAGVSGTVTEVLVKNGQAVEFGQPLFRVNPA